MKKIKNIILIISFLIVFLIILGAFIATFLDVFISLNIVKNEQIKLFRDFLYKVYGPLDILIFLLAIISLFIYLYKQRRK